MSELYLAAKVDADGKFIIIIMLLMIIIIRLANFAG